MATAEAVMDGVDLRVVPLTALSPAPGNPRKSVGDVADLATSMKAHGVLEPLVVVEAPKDKYLVVCGLRRLKAAKEARLSGVPIIVRDLNAKQMLEVMLIENLQRENLTPMEEALTFAKLVNELGYSQRSLGEVVGVSQAHISKRLSLLNLPKDIQSAVGKGELPVADAVELARVEPKVAKQLFEQIKRSGTPAKPQVDRLLADEARKAKIEKATAQAKATYKTVIAYDEMWRADVERIGQNSYDPEFKKLSISAHEKLDCHAVAVDRDAEIIPVCIKPSNHVKDRPAAGLSAREEKRKQEEKKSAAALRESRKQRREHLAWLVTTRLGAQDRLAGIVLGTLTGTNAGPAKFACDLLGLELVKGQYTRDAIGPLRKEAKRGPEQAARVALAVALGYLEESFDGYMANPVDNAEYLAWLRKTGYRTTAAEKTRVEKKA